MLCTYSFLRPLIPALCPSLTDSSVWGSLYCLAGVISLRQRQLFSWSDWSRQELKKQSINNETVLILKEKLIQSQLHPKIRGGDESVRVGALSEHRSAQFRMCRRQYCPSPTGPAGFGLCLEKTRRFSLKPNFFQKYCFTSCNCFIIVDCTRPRITSQTAIKKAGTRKRRHRSKSVAVIHQAPIDSYIENTDNIRINWR